MIICTKNRGPLVQLMVELMVHTWCLLVLVVPASPGHQETVVADFTMGASKSARFPPP